MLAHVGDIRSANTVSFWWGDLMERDHSEDLVVERKILLPRQAMHVQRKI
jgi:hypothetical protein